MRIDEFEFRNERGQEIEPTKAMLVCYIKALHKDIKELTREIELFKNLPAGCIPSEILAIAKLEEVKKDILGIEKTEIKTLKNGYSTLYIDRPEIITIIDKHIKQLKEK